MIAIQYYNLMDSLLNDRDGIKIDRYVDRKIE